MCMWPIQVFFRLAEGVFSNTPDNDPLFIPDL